MHTNLTKTCGPFDTARHESNIFFVTSLLYLQVVDIFKNPTRYGQLGARMPRGVLLAGPPGTGKTLLAKATAGECGVSFFYASASDFVEVLVGRGAARVRDLFQRARAAAPSIIFIDEMDAVAKSRNNSMAMGGACEEREQTLDALLSEMDGFSNSSRKEAGTEEASHPVVVIAATNRPEVLDRAILRPGRFDRLVMVGLPDASGRNAILKLHSERIGDRMHESVNLKSIADATQGLSGAELSNIVNEAALLAVRADSHTVQHSHFQAALGRVGLQHARSCASDGSQPRSPAIPLNLLLPN